MCFGGVAAPCVMYVCSDVPQGYVLWVPEWSLWKVLMNGDRK